jgi:integrase
MLREWCADVPADAPFEPKGHRKRLERLRDSAGLRKNWPHDVLRHTFATMHYAMFQNRAQLQALMGHSGSENTLFQHYRAVLTVSGETVTARMAEEFWGLTPKRCRPTNPPR